MGKNITVTTTNGKIVGFRGEKTDLWQGVPYAQPPVGQLRFRRAQPPEPWRGELDCGQTGCQPIQFSRAARDSFTENEDCLNLNICAPRNAQNLPVLVWLPGGLFNTGKTTTASLYSAQLALEGLIFVTFNYRLGPLGFYDLSRRDPEFFDSNCGLSDQIAALRWVKNNIAAFGGDPERIIVGGQGAAASSVLNLLSSPAAAGLISKAIAHSPLPGYVLGAEAAEHAADLFVQKMGLPPEGAWRIKDAPVNQLIEAANQLMSDYAGKSREFLPPGPVIDDLLPAAPGGLDSFVAEQPIPLLIGTNRNEGTIYTGKNLPLFFSDWAQIQQHLNSGEWTPPQALLDHYNGLPEKIRAIEFNKDCRFLVDTLRFADRYSATSPTWMYRFDFVTSLGKLSKLGAYHGMEMPFVLDSLENYKATFTFTPKHTLAGLRHNMHSLWANFILHDQPSQQGLPEWPAYDAEQRKTLILDKNCRWAADPDQGIREAWGDWRLFDKR